MRDWLNGFFGADGGRAAQMIIALTIVVGLIVLVAWIIRRVSGGRMGGTPGGRDRGRLAVVDAANVDGRRRLVLLRRDDVEHLVMIGGPNDVLLESRIARAPLPAIRDLAAMQAPPQAEAAPAPGAPLQPPPLARPEIPTSPGRADQVTADLKAALERRRAPAEISAAPPEAAAPPPPPQAPAQLAPAAPAPAAASPAPQAPAPQVAEPAPSPASPPQRPPRRTEPPVRAEAAAESAAPDVAPDLPRQGPALKIGGASLAQEDEERLREEPTVMIGAKRRDAEAPAPVPPPPPQPQRRPAMMPPRRMTEAAAGEPGPAPAVQTPPTAQPGPAAAPQAQAPARAEEPRPIEPEEARDIVAGEIERALADLASVIQPSRGEPRPTRPAMPIPRMSAPQEPARPAPAARTAPEPTTMPLPPVRPSAPVSAEPPTAPPPPLRPPQAPAARSAPPAPPAPPPPPPEPPKPRSPAEELEAEMAKLLSELSGPAQR